MTVQDMIAILEFLESRAASVNFSETELQEWRDKFAAQLAAALNA